MGEAQPTFVDDFSDSEFARFYEIQGGAGEVQRRSDGLYFVIERGLSGPSSAEEYLSIDYLGRPQPPSTRAILRFSGMEWTLEASLEYHFARRTNGRSANFGVIFGDTADQRLRSVTLSRSADLPQESHALSVAVQRDGKTIVYRTLMQTPVDQCRFTVSRQGSTMKIRCRAAEDFDLGNFEWQDPLAPRCQCVLINSNSFAGGAAFVVREVRLSGARPIPGRIKPAAFSIPQAETETRVPAEALIEALQAHQDIEIENCRITGRLNLTLLPSLVLGGISAYRCFFDSGINSAAQMRFAGPISFASCRFGPVGFSLGEFAAPFQAVRCDFAGDTRFIGTEFQAGADFSGSHFAEKPYFRIARAAKPVSFYAATFEKGADFSSTFFTSDLSISNLAVLSGSLPFYKSEIKGDTKLIATLERDQQPLGDEIDFSAAKLHSLIVSAGDPHGESEQTGPARWEFAARVSLWKAEVDALLLHNVHFRSLFDMSMAKLGSIWIDGPRFTELKGDWPVARVHGSPVSILDAAQVYDDQKDVFNHRRAYWDGQANKKSWWRPALRLFWWTSAYGTSFLRLLATGAILWALIGMLAVGAIPAPAFVRLAKPYEIHTHLSDTPWLSGPRPKDSTPVSSGVRDRIPACLQLSLEVFGKFGVGAMRLDPQKVPMAAYCFVWFIWGLGFLYYVVGVYTLTGTVPILKGIFW
jgi:hypothetical protein